MVNLKGFRGFAIQSGDNSREALKLFELCIKQNIPYKSVKEKTPCPVEYVPCGTVEWCELSLKHHFVPDYYPLWAKDILYREVWFEDKWITGRRLFVKPADRYKRFDGFITDGAYTKKKGGKLVWSEVVHFENEWRYYITKGKVVCAGWYDGDINEPEPPALTFEIPDNYYGALDIGQTMWGLSLIESQHPFACGHYSEDHEAYFQWLVDGWEYMRGL